MLKKGKKLLVVLLAMSIVLGGVGQVAFAEDPGTEDPTGGNTVNSELNAGGDQTDGEPGDQIGIGDQTGGGQSGDKVDGDTDGDQPGDQSGDENGEESENGNNSADIVVNEDFTEFLTAFRFYNTTTKEDYSSENPVKNNDSVGIRFDFTVPNPGEIKEGATYILPALPEQFNLAGIDADHDYKLGEGDYAVWSIGADRVITVKFTKALPENNVKGHLEVFCVAEVDETQGGVIKFDLGKFAADIDGFDIYQKPEEETKDLGIAKSGVLNDDNTVTWTITATPDQADTLAGYTITDTYDKAQLTYLPGSMKIDGKEISDDLLSLNDGEFSYTFPSDISDGPHVITYQTSISDGVWYKGPRNNSWDSSVSVENKAALTSADGKAEVSTTATVKARDTFLKKDSVGDKNWETRVDENGDFLLTYKIKVIYGKGNDNFTTAKIVDTINAKKGAAFVADSVKINYSGDNSENAEPVNVEIETEGDNTTMTIPLSTEHQKAWVYYTIKVSKDNEFNQNQFTGFSLRNDAFLVVDDSHKIGGDYEIWQSELGSNDKVIFFTKDGKFSTSEDKNWINWTINVNKGQKDLTKPITIIDTVGDKQKLDESSISIKYNGEEKVGIDAKYVIDKNNPNKITFTLNNVGKSAVVITYKMEITEFRVENGNSTTGFENSVILKYEGIDDQHIKKSKVDVNHSELLKKQGSFDTAASTYGDKGYFNWTITFNAKEYALTNGTITEALPEGHKLVENSLEVNGKKITKDVSGTDVYYEMIDGNPVIHIPGTVTKAQVITLKTVCDIPEETKVLNAVNNCQATAKEFKGSLKAKETVDVSFTPSVEKSTDYRVGNTVKWSVTINKDGKNIITKQNAVLTDVLPPSLKYQNGSAKLYDGNKTEIKGLTVDYDENTKTLKMKMPDNLDLTKTYIVEFKTDIVANHQGIKNTITFDGSAEEVVATSGSVNLVAGGLDSSLTGDNIRFELTKADADNTSKVLSGAEFALYDEQGVKVGTAKSDANGKLAFDKGLRFGQSYTFKEIKAPKGYVLDDKEHKMSIGSVIENNGQKSAEITMGDETFLAHLDANNTLTINITVYNSEEEDTPPPTPTPDPTPTPTPTPVPPTPTPTPDPDPTPDQKPLPPDENLEDPENPENPGGDDVVRPELPDDEHMEIDETTKKDNSNASREEDPNLPQTGDNAEIMLWTILLITSLSAAVVIIAYRRRIEKE